MRTRVSVRPHEHCPCDRSFHMHVLATLLLGVLGAMPLNAQTLVGPVTITFDEVADKTVLSKCVGGGVLPACTGGKVENVYPGLTFYSGPRINSGPLRDNQVVAVKLPPVPPSFLNTANPPTVPIPTSTNVACAQASSGGADCRGRVFVKFAPGVTRLTFTVAAGYDVRPQFFVPDDINAVVTYGPAGLQIQQFFARMFFVWNRFFDLTALPLAHITSIELFTTSGHMATFGMGGNQLPGLGGGIGIDSLSFVAPGLCTDINNNGNVDDDGDGLCDNWETSAIDFDGDGVIDLNLPLAGATPDFKDVFVEIDYMSGDATNTHTPDADALTAMQEAFAQAPVPNPNNQMNGIRLHFEVDNTETTDGRTGIPEVTPLEWVIGSNNNSFNYLKSVAPTNPNPKCAGYFGTAFERGLPGCAGVLAAKRWVYHYVIYGHQAMKSGVITKAIGIAEILGNDALIVLGRGKDDKTSGLGKYIDDAAKEFHTSFASEWSNLEAGDLMHEFGHNLNLRHGGADNINCKPNYISVMNYTRSYNYAEPTIKPPVVQRARSGRKLDYSIERLPTLSPHSLHENNLNETAGVGGGFSTDRVFFGVASSGVMTLGQAGGSIDWDGNGSTTTAQADINFVTGFPACPTSFGQVLSGHDDWGTSSIASAIPDTSPTAMPARRIPNPNQRPTMS